MARCVKPPEKQKKKQKMIKLAALLGIQLSKNCSMQHSNLKWLVLIENWPSLHRQSSPRLRNIWQLFFPAQSIMWQHHYITASHARKWPQHTVVNVNTADSAEKKNARRHYTKKWRGKIKKEGKRDKSQHQAGFDWLERDQSTGSMQGDLAALICTSALMCQ